MFGKEIIENILDKLNIDYKFVNDTFLFTYKNEKFKVGYSEREPGEYSVWVNKFYVFEIDGHERGMGSPSQTPFPSDKLENYICSFINYDKTKMNRQMTIFDF